MTDSTLVALAKLAKDGAVYAVEQIKLIAPVAWEMARQKVMADIVIIPLVPFIISVATLIIGLVMYKLNDSDEDYLVPWAVISAVDFIFFVVLLAVSIRNYICIDYCTAMELMRLIKH